MVSMRRPTRASGSVPSCLRQGSNPTTDSKSTKKSGLRQQCEITTVWVDHTAVACNGAEGDKQAKKTRTGT